MIIIVVMIIIIIISIHSSIAFSLSVDRKTKGHQQMTPISWRMYLITTWIGLTPFQIMWVYLGTTLRSITDAAQGNLEGSPGQVISLALQLLAGFAVPLYLCFRNRSRPPVQSGVESDIQGVVIADSFDEPPQLSATDQLFSTSVPFPTAPFSPFSESLPPPSLRLSSDKIVVLQDKLLTNHRRTNSQEVHVV